MENICITYNGANTQREYEMVLDVRLRLFLAVYEGLKSEASENTKQVIFTISKSMPGDKSARRVSVLRGNKLVGDVFESKTVLSTFKEDIGSGLQIRHRTSAEVPIGRTEFPVTDNPYVSLKVRDKLKIGDWDFDFNVMIEAPSIQPLHDAYKNNVVTDDYTNFVDYVESRETHKFSIEAEYRGKDLSPQKISDIKEKILKHISVEGGSVYDLHKIARLIGQSFARTRRVNTITDIINKPVGLNKIKYAEISSSINKYYLSPKLDGERCIVMLCNESYAITLSGVVNIPHSQPHETLLDAEIYNEEFVVIDLLYDNGVHFAYSVFETRLKHLKEITLPSNFRLQAFDEINEAADIETLYVKYADLGLKTDGLIFTPKKINSTKAITGAPVRYFDDKIFKWKPPESLTIDFAVVSVPHNLVGIEPFKPIDGKMMFVLCCTSSLRDRTNFYLIDIFPDIRSDRKQLMFQTSIKKNVAVYYHDTDISNTVSEFRVSNKGVMEFVKVRQDKTAEFKSGMQFGNNIRTAEAIYFNALNPLTIDMMKEAKVEYFASKKTKKHQAVRANNRIKDMLFETYIKSLGSCRLVDLCCGKGQDLKRCYDSKVTTLIGIDSSFDALEEMNERKYSVVRNSPMKIVLVHADLNNEEVNIDERGDVIVINFAIHYLVRDVRSLNRLCDQMDKLGTGDYTLIITCFDGKSVMDALDDNGEFKREKYYIKANLPSQGSRQNGPGSRQNGPGSQQNGLSRDTLPTIKVLHHFNDEPLEEHLIDSEWLINGLKPRFKLVSTKLFDSRDVDGEDKEYHNLYRYYVFTRKI